MDELMSQKCILPPSAKRYFLPDKHNFATGGGRTAGRKCVILFQWTLITCLTLGSIAIVADAQFSELYVMRVFSFYFSQLIAKVRPDKHCISAFR